MAVFPSAAEYRCRLRLPPRRAFTVLEITLACALLAMLLAASVQMMRVVSDRQRATERRYLALQAAQAISEQFANLPWEELSDEVAAQAAIPEPLAARLPGARATLTVAEESEPAAKRIHVEIAWNDRSGLPTRPVRLTSWSFPDELP